MLATFRILLENALDLDDSFLVSCLGYFTAKPLHIVVVFLIAARNEEAPVLSRST